MWFESVETTVEYWNEINTYIQVSYFKTTVPTAPQNLLSSYHTPFLDINMLLFVIKEAYNDVLATSNLLHASHWQNSKATERSLISAYHETLPPYIIVPRRLFSSNGTHLPIRLCIDGYTQPWDRPWITRHAHNAFQPPWKND